METVKSNVYVNAYACTAPEGLEFLCSNCDKSVKEAIILMTTGNGAISRIFICEDCIKGLLKLSYGSE